MFSHPEFLNHHPTSSHSILTSSHTCISVKNGNMMNSSEVGHRKRNSVAWCSAAFWTGPAHPSSWAPPKLLTPSVVRPPYWTPGDTVLRIARPLHGCPSAWNALPPCLPRNSLSILAVSSPDSAKMLLLESCRTAPHVSHPLQHPRAYVIHGHLSHSDATSLWDIKVFCGLAWNSIPMCGPVSGGQVDPEF